MTFRMPIVFWLGLPVVIAAPLLIAGPGLLADTRNGPAWALARDLTVTKADCTNWEFVASTCSIPYSAPSRAEVMPELGYFVYGSWAKERIVLLRSTRDPALVSTLQGIRDLRARQVTMIGWVAMWLGLAACIVFRPRSRRSPRPVHATEDRPQTSALARLADGTDPLPILPAMPVPASPPTFGRRRT